jgi:hypothetical protein
MEVVMTNSHVSLGAGIAGALLLAVPVLRMLFGAPGPVAADAIVGVFGVVMLALWATAAVTRTRNASRPRATRARASLLGGSHARP